MLTLDQDLYTYRVYSAKVRSQASSHVATAMPAAAVTMKEMPESLAYLVSGWNKLMSVALNSNSKC